MSYGKFGELLARIPEVEPPVEAILPDNLQLTIHPWRHGEIADAAGIRPVAKENDIVALEFGLVNPELARNIQRAARGDYKARQNARMLAGRMNYPEFGVAVVEQLYDTRTNVIFPDLQAGNSRHIALLQRLAGHFSGGKFNLGDSLEDGLASERQSATDFAKAVVDRDVEVIKNIDQMVKEASEKARRRPDGSQRAALFFGADHMCLFAWLRQQNPAQVQIKEVDFETIAHNVLMIAESMPGFMSEEEMAELTRYSFKEQMVMGLLKLWKPDIDATEVGIPVTKEVDNSDETLQRLRDFGSNLLRQRLTDRSKLDFEPVADILELAEQHMQSV